MGKFDGAASARAGFTLIELLVVIAIVAILAALLFPILTSAKANATRTACANNIKQIVIAALAYSDDWSGRLPGLNAFGDIQDGRFSISSRTPKPSVGRGTLWSYLKTRAIFICPVDLQHRTPADMSNAQGLGGFNYTYSVNSFMTLASVDRKLADIAGPPVSKSKGASKTVLLVDENTDPKKGLCTLNDAHFATGDSTCDRHPGRADYSPEYGSYGAVGGCANVGYLDGHVGTLPGLLRWDSREGQKIFLR